MKRLYTKRKLVNISYMESVVLQVHIHRVVDRTVGLAVMDLNRLRKTQCTNGQRKIFLPMNTVNFLENRKSRMQTR